MDLNAANNAGGFQKASRYVVAVVRQGRAGRVGNACSGWLQNRQKDELTKAGLEE